MLNLRQRLCKICKMWQEPEEFVSGDGVTRKVCNSCVAEITKGTKLCSYCGHNKPRIQFMSASLATEYPYCQYCHATNERARRHKVDDELPKACAICGVVFDANRHKRHWDHDHVTGKFRGWLCRMCNHGLGQFRDNVEVMLKAIKYLEKSRE